MNFDEKLQYSIKKFPLVGEMLIAGRKGKVYCLSFVDGKKFNSPPPHWEQGTAEISNIIEELTLYFDGKLRRFTIPYSIQGPQFTQKVLQNLALVPFAETISYKQLSTNAGSPLAVRAVGNINANNLLPIVLPCHRVIGTNGKLVGYGGGLALKEKLIKFEREILSN